jgi:hypothetical protein
VLLAGAATGGLDAGDFPDPVGVGLIVAAGVALAALSVVIWRGAIGLRALVAGNAATALAGLVWLLAADGFSSAGGWLVGVTVVGLSALVIAQVSVLS